MPREMTLAMSKDNVVLPKHSIVTKYVHCIVWKVIIPPSIFVVFSKTSPSPLEVLVYLKKFLYTCILFLGFFPGSFDGVWFNTRNIFLKAECKLYPSSPQNVIVAFVLQMSEVRFQATTLSHG